jgi:hypothetical protein
MLGIESTKVEVDAQMPLPGFHCCEHTVRFVTLLHGFGDRKDPATSLWHGFFKKLLGALQHRRNVSQGRR